MLITLLIDGMAIKTVDIPIDNPDFQLKKDEMANDFESWISDYFV
jgi:hypothetical protein